MTENNLRRRSTAIPSPQLVDHSKEQVNYSELTTHTYTHTQQAQVSKPTQHNIFTNPLIKKTTHKACLAIMLHASQLEVSAQLRQHQQEQQNIQLERRIIELLTRTNLTFKEIIQKLDRENLSASVGIIRRINRDNRYRRPRYDSKLTPAQRESLVEKLRNHTGRKPNLSLLAKQFNVCHGSVWYWWDKLNRIKRRDPVGRRSGPGAESSRVCTPSRSVDGSLFYRQQQCKKLNSCRSSQSTSPSSASSSSSGAFRMKGGDLYDDDEMVQGGESSSSSTPASSTSSSLDSSTTSHNQPRAQRQHTFNNFLLDDKYSLVGRVTMEAREDGGNVGLPILMFSSKVLAEVDSAKTGQSSSSSSFADSCLLDLSPQHHHEVVMGNEDGDEGKPSMDDHGPHLVGDSEEFGGASTSNTLEDLLSRAKRPARKLSST